MDLGTLNIGSKYGPRNKRKIFVLIVKSISENTISRAVRQAMYVKRKIEAHLQQLL
jgi:hypothetical protein